MTEASTGAVAGPGPAGEDELPAGARRIWVAMGVLVCLDFLLGIGAIAEVPYSRVTGWLPAKGRGLYVPHAVIGAALALGAVYLVTRYRRSTHRIARLAAKWGIAGIGVGVVGGLLAVVHPLRLAGMGLMLVGGLAAAIGYFMPSLEAHDRKERAALQERLDAEAADGPFG